MAIAPGGGTRQPESSAALGDGQRGLLHGAEVGGCHLLVLVPSRVLERGTRLARGGAGVTRSVDAYCGAGGSAHGCGYPCLVTRRPRRGALPAGRKRNLMPEPPIQIWPRPLATFPEHGDARTRRHYGSPFNGRRKCGNRSDRGRWV